MMVVRVMRVMMVMRVSMACPMVTPAATSRLTTPTPASTTKWEGKSPWIVGMRVSDRDHVVFNVCPLAFTGGAEIIVMADETLVAGAIDGSTASITDDSWVDDLLLWLGLRLL